MFLRLALTALVIGLLIAQPRQVDARAGVEPAATKAATPRSFEPVGFIVDLDPSVVDSPSTSWLFADAHNPTSDFGQQGLPGSATALSQEEQAQKDLEETRNEQRIAKHIDEAVDRIARMRDDGELETLPADLSNAPPGTVGAPGSWRLTSDPATSGSSGNRPSSGNGETPGTSSGPIASPAATSPSAAGLRDLADEEIVQQACRSPKLFAKMLGSAPAASRRGAAAAQERRASLIFTVVRLCDISFVAKYIASLALVDAQSLLALEGGQHVCRHMSAALVKKWSVNLCRSMSPGCFQGLSPSAYAAITPGCLKVMPPVAFRGFTNASWLLPSTIAKIDAAQVASVNISRVCATVSPLMVHNSLNAKCRSLVAKVTRAPYVRGAVAKLVDAAAGTMGDPALPELTPAPWYKPGEGSFTVGAPASSDASGRSSYFSGLSTYSSSSTGGSGGTVIVILFIVVAGAAAATLWISRGRRASFLETVTTSVGSAATSASGQSGPSARSSSKPGYAPL